MLAATIIIIPLLLENIIPLILETLKILELLKKQKITPRYDLEVTAVVEVVFDRHFPR